MAESITTAQYGPRSWNEYRKMDDNQRREIINGQPFNRPDLLVVCNPDQIRLTHIEGQPMLVVEILSPGSLAHDRPPKPPLVEVLVLKDATYLHQCRL